MKAFFTRLFGKGIQPPNSPPNAAQCATEDGLETAGWVWYFAQPMHLEARMEHLVPSADLSARLDTLEWQQLESLLNGHFDAETGRFFLALNTTSNPTPRLYLRVSAPFAFSPLPVNEIIGRPIASHWPSATDARALARPLAQRLNEIQMLLHEQPFNEARESRGEAPVNGLWLWDIPAVSKGIKPQGHRPPPLAPQPNPR